MVCVKLSASEKRILLLRLCFITSMMAAGALFGVVAYKVTQKLEKNTAEKTYESIAESALEQATAIAIRKAQGGEVLSTMLSHAFPKASMWPFVGLEGYTAIARSVAKLSSTSGHGCMAIVRPEEADLFEEHAQKLYKDFGYPEEAGMSDFGFGIYDQNPALSTCEDQKYHDNSGNTTYNSEYSIMVPFLQHSNTYVKPSLLMLNLHAKQFRGEVMDSIIKCAEEADPASSQPPSCGVVTAITELFIRPGPSAVFFQPIFPAEDPTKVVGFIGTSIHWQEVLTNVVPDYVDGLDCVISTDDESYTYTIRNGIPVLVGEGDLHDPVFYKYAQSKLLNVIEDSGASKSTRYTLTVYPTNTMFDEFRTEIPIYVSGAFVIVIFVCTAIFFLYDHAMQHKSHQRKMVLEAQRRFVRFVSHEIRTPLNVVCMGVEFLQAELRDKINPGSSDKAGNGIATNDNQEERRIRGRASSDKDIADAQNSGLQCWLNITEDLLENTKNAVSVLNGLLQYDKIQSGTFKMQAAPVDIWKLVNKSVSEFTIQARNKQITLNLNVASDGDVEESRSLQGLCVIGDDIRLTQVIRNLVSNALKFTPENGAITVDASYVPDGLPDYRPAAKKQPSSASANLVGSSPRAGSVRISVKDSGVGLTQDQVGLLFQEGMQFDPNKLQAGNGSGLGLCITKDIVEKHEGMIEAQSEGQGLGATFIVEIPLHKLDMDENESKNDETSTTMYSPSLLPSSCYQGCEHRHVLVVDDVRSNTKMLERLLQREGHTTVAASDGQNAIDAFLENKDAFERGEADALFDTVLMDAQMPVLCGPDAARQMRDLGCKALIVGVTGNVLEEDVAYFKSNGADHVLAKPINLCHIKCLWDSHASSREEPMSSN